MTDPLDLGPDHLDYLVYIAINCELNDWEHGFCTSTINYLKLRNGRMLSDKQVACVNRMLRAFKISKDEVGSNFATSETIVEALDELEATKPKPKYEQRQQQQPHRPASYFDDPDDDIPF